MSKKFQALELLAATDRPPPCEIGRSINCQLAVIVFEPHNRQISPLPTTTSDDATLPPPFLLPLTPLLRCFLLLHLLPQDLLHHQRGTAAIPWNADQLPRAASSASRMAE